MKIAIKKYQILNLCLPGIGIIVIIFFLFHNIPFLKGLNHLLLDQFIYYTGHHLPADDIVLIVIDDESAAQFGSPLSRKHYADLIPKLSNLGARTIVFDLIFQDEK